MLLGAFKPRAFEVKFPLWLKDKVEFLACLNMLTVSPLMKQILFFKFWRKKNNSNLQTLFTIWHFNYSLFCQKQNLKSTKITSKIKHKIFFDVMFVLTNSKSRLHICILVICVLCKDKNLISNSNFLGSWPSITIS